MAELALFLRSLRSLRKNPHIPPEKTAPVSNQPLRINPKPAERIEDPIRVADRFPMPEHLPNSLIGIVKQVTSIIIVTRSPALTAAQE
jgi:hypothetical protein